MSTSWKIKLTVSGGFAGGAPREHSLDSAQLTGAALARAQGVVESSGILSIAAHKAAPPMGDMETYKFEVTNDGTTHTLYYRDGDMPEKISALAHYLEKNG